MQELTTDQLKAILKTSCIEGTPNQIRLLAIRVSELCRLNGREWVAANAGSLLDQWKRALCRMAENQGPQDTNRISATER
jgi:hypothetical protein